MAEELQKNSTVERETSMLIRETHGGIYGITEIGFGLHCIPGNTRSVLKIAIVAILFAVPAGGQQDPPPRTPHPILLPEANHLPDVNDQMVLRQQNVKKQNFEAANLERKRQMDNESAKLLILAKDLKAQTDKLGNDALSPRAVREAEIIELLAHDLKEKMKLTVGGN